MHHQDQWLTQLPQRWHSQNGGGGSDAFINGREGPSIDAELSARAGGAGQDRKCNFNAFFLRHNSIHVQSDKGIMAV